MSFRFNYFDYFEQVPKKGLEFMENRDDPKYADRNDSLLPATITVNPTDPKYGDDKQPQRTHTFSIARTKGGRIYLAYFSSTGHGAEDVGNYNMVITSDDDGNSFQNRVLIESPTQDTTRVFDVVFFTEETGRLWIMWSQTFGCFDGRSGVWAIHTDNADDDVPIFTEPKRLTDGTLAMNPIVTKDGRWLMATYCMDPRSLQHIGSITGPRGMMVNWEAENMGVSVYESTDGGETWKRIAKQIQFNYSSFDEPCMAELDDGTLWMLIRGKNCCGETFSYDGGHTWTVPKINFKYNFPDAHWTFQKLKSGNILMLAHYKADMFSYYGGRNHLTAMISKDEGATWEGFLSLDEREGAEQPSFIEGDDGFIYISWGRAPQFAGESLMAIVTEEDILAGKQVNPKSRMRILAGKSTGMQHSPDYESWHCRIAKEYNIEL